ncbi:hypothetical protein H1P_2380007 [Hyella patelloides LEGE 07179]|uniref:Uncharacterized protein n=1 Tax=Hyella patelloides LEGE 07179 TaxID=945734 RepID=A0A563VRJ9_9CYAN|nr:hypothetical protein H1P_2380007 [Hyella patelloides LEGE 07179]
MYEKIILALLHILKHHDFIDRFQKTYLDENFGIKLFDYS